MYMFPSSTVSKKCRFPGKPGSRIEDRGSRIEDRGSRIEDQGSRIDDQEKKKNKQNHVPSAKCTRYRGRIDQNNFFK